MKVYDTPEIRNVVLIGHGDSGKTSLVSAILYRAGAANRLESVDDGNTTTDWEDEEIDRKVTLSTGIAHCEWKETKINLLDSPGYSAFVHEAKMAMRVAETAIVLIDAVSGVEVQTEKTWSFADELDRARMVVINRLDRQNADFDRALASCQENLGREVVPMQLPLGKEADFSGVIDLVTMTATKFAGDGSGKGEKIDIPADMADRAEEARAALIEMVAEADDELLETFLEAGELTDEQFSKGLKTAIRLGKIYPVLCCAATKNVGTSLLMDAIVDLCPHPDDYGEIAGHDPKADAPATRNPSADDPLAAFVWKTIADPFTGKITLFKVLSGVLQSDTTAHNITRSEDTRLGGLFLLQGKEHVKIGSLRAGDIGAIAKLKETETGDTLGMKASPFVFPPTDLPEPAMSFSIAPKAKGDEEKISTGLQRLCEEDPILTVQRDAQTGELLIAGTGQVHVEVAVSRLRRRFGVEVTLKPPTVPYRETITKKAQGQYRHKKQTGGAGQFAEVHLRIEPLESGEGFDYGWEVFGGAISQGFKGSIEKGIKAVMAEGVIAGFPVVDVRAVVFDGKEHPVDSKDVAFQIAGREVFKKCVLEAKPTLLEPIMKVQVMAPEENTGDVVGDLNGRRAKMQGMDPKGKRVLVRAEVPLAEMLNYAPALNSTTGGRGDFHMEFSHYQNVPSHLLAKIVEAKKAAKES
jgi:elongation factor G